MEARLSFVRRALVIAGLGAGLSCATHAAPPPRELGEARAAYQRAIQGPATRADPIRLGLAGHALNEAERSYRYGAKPQDVRDRAYLSMRLTQTAEAEAAVQMLAARRHRAVGQLAALEARQRGQRAQQALYEQQHQARAEQEAELRALPGKVTFAFDESTLEPQATKVLDQEAKVLKERPADAPPVVIEGHTDSTGDPAYNQDLAQRRAEVVRDYLMSRGVEGTAVTVESAGPEKPVGDNDTPDGRAQNRRVEIEIPATPTPTPVTTPHMRPPLTPEAPTP